MADARLAIETARAEQNPALHRHDTGPPEAPMSSVGCWFWETERWWAMMACSY